MSKKMFSILIGVASFHVILFAMIFMMQGCRTTTSKHEAPTSADIIMPPTKEAVEAPYVPPAPPPPRQKKIEEAAALPKEAGAYEYVVQKGDTLGSIAHKHGVTITELKDANKIQDVNKIRVGQKLIIPATKAPKADDLKHKSTTHSKASSAHKSEKNAKAVSASPNEYVVQPGDSLSKIAAKHGVKVSDLKRANNLTTDRVKVNQKLKIPEKETTQSKISSAEKSKLSEPTTSRAVVSSAETTKPTFEPTKEPAVITSSASSAPSSVPPATTSASTTEQNTSAGSGSQASKSTAVGSSQSTPSSFSSKDYSFEHVVRPDDDLNKIARMYATKVEDIIALNNLGANTNLTVGQKIKIPNL